MGLIRKTLFISTAGVVRPNSKKQRVAKAQLKELRTQTEILQRAEEEAEERRLKEWSQRQQAEMRREAERRELAQQPVAPPPAGWYPDADHSHLLRWWDGQQWTEQTAPRG